MRRYIVLLLITGIVWAQTDFYDYDLPYDEYFGGLVLKDGTTYLGEYSKTEEEIVYFKPQDALAFQPVPVELIKQLQLKDGQFIILDGKDILAYEEYQKKSLEENQKLSTKNVVIIGCIIVVFFIAVAANSFSLIGLGGGCVEFDGTGKRKDCP